MSIASEGGCEEQKEASTETCLWTNARGTDKTTGSRTKPVTALIPSIQAFVLNQWCIYLSSTMFVLHRTAQSVSSKAAFYTVCACEKCIFMHSKTLVEPNSPRSIPSSGIFAGAAGHFLENKEIRTILWEVTCSK